MTTETETLDVLRKLHTLLSASSKTAGSTAGGRGAKDSDGGLGELSKHTKVSAGRVQSLGENSKSAAGELKTLASNAEKSHIRLGLLSTTVGATTKSFVAATKKLDKLDLDQSFAAITAALKKASEDISQAYQPSGKNRKGKIAGGAERAAGDDGAVTDLTKKIGILSGRIGGASGDGALNGQLVRATRNVRLFSNAIDKSLKCLDTCKTARKTTSRTTVAGAMIAGPIARGGKPGKAAPSVMPATTSGSTTPSSNTPSTDDSPAPGNTLTGAGILAAIGGAFTALGRSIRTIIDDSFQTMGERGFGTIGNDGGSSLITLYKNAALAGMSLREYAQTMDENEGLVSRSGTFEAFDKQLDISRAGLEKFGIFGQEATKLAVAMQGSAQTLGVPMADSAAAANAQVKAFEELRKTTGISAGAFEEMVRNLQQNEVVQKELLGLAPAERAARLGQLTQTAAWGKSLGLSRQEQDKLTQALLAQRKTTVKERFNSRGRITQAMSLVGMDSDSINEARDLTSKRNKTPEEEKRLTELLGEYRSRSEAAMQNDSSPGMQFQVESMNEKLGETALAPLLDAAGAVRAAKDSGAQIQADFNKTLGKVESMLGRLIGVLEGIMKSPLGMLGMGAVAAGASLAMAVLQAKLTGAAVALALRGGSMLSGIGEMFGKKSSAPVPTVGGAPVPAASTGTAPARDARGRFIKSAAPTVTTPVPDVQAPPAPQAKGAGRFGRIGGAGMLATGLAVAGGLYSAVSGYSNAEEAAKVENGGDGDVGKEKGKAIGEGLGVAVGGVAGSMLAAALVPVTGGLSLLAAPLLSMAGSIIGSWGGKFIGALIGSESATEKNAKILKKNTDELVKANRLKAGPEVIDSNNLAGLDKNIMDSAKSYAAPTATELEKFADNKLTPEERDAKKKEADAKKAEDTKAKVQADASAASANMIDPEAGLIASAAIDKNKPVGFGDVTSVSATKPSSTPIASPVPDSRSSVNPALVNSPEKEVAKTIGSTAAAASAALTAPAAQTSTEVLTKILAILQDSLVAENLQVELTGQLIRNSSDRFLDNRTMMNRSLA